MKFEGSLAERVGPLLTDRVMLVALGLLTLIGLALRINVAGYTVFGDELSTLWIVRNHGLLETVSVVHSQAEITPPLYFVLAWITTHLGSAPELVRLPALIAGTLAIPMTWLLGLRTIGRTAGLLAALVMTISPYMIFLSAYGRAYSLMIFFLIASALALLAAIRSEHRLRWWVAFAFCACLAMYSHYTAAFVLAGEVIWVLWTQPRFRKPVLLASVGAAVLYAPWFSGVISDMDSPTKDIMEFLQGDGLVEKLKELGQWLAGNPAVELGDLPGGFGVALILGGLVIAVAGAGWQLWQGRNLQQPAGSRARLALVGTVVLATPVAALALNLVGTDLLGARNLAAAWAGLAVLIGGLIALSPFRVGLLATALTIAGFLVGTVIVSDPGISGTGQKDAAAFVEGEATERDVVLDTSHYTPVPLTQLAAHLDGDFRQFTPNLAKGDPPFVPLLSVADPPQQVVDQAFREAGENRVFSVTRAAPATKPGEIPAEPAPLTVPPGWVPVETRTWSGYMPVTVTVFEPSGQAGSRAGGTQATEGP